MDDWHGFSLWFIFFAVVDEREVGAFLNLDPLEILHFLPKVRAFEVRVFEVFLEAFVVVLELVEEDSRAVFDDEFRGGVDVEVRVVRVVQPYLGQMRVPGGR